MKERLVCLSALAAVLVAGCNTMSGIGRDIEAGGDAIQRSADRNR
jgi:predicted small secreted protein